MTTHTTSAAILDAESRVLAGASLSAAEAEALLSAEGADLMLLFSAADRVRRKFRGDAVHLCGIVNAKSGACSENCTYCAQSVRNHTGVEIHPLLPVDEMVAAACRAAGVGAKAFGIVTAWRGIEQGRNLDLICEAIRRIRAEAGIAADCALGIIRDPAVAAQLAEAGAGTYNHNLETARSFFPSICTTHSWEERMHTLELVQAAGLGICCGGIFGMGESLKQRVEFILQLRDADPDIVPVNFYYHTPGNAVAPPVGSSVKALEALRLVAVMRLVLPRQIIKLAGGREAVLGQFQALMFLTGANSTMVGNYLTSPGRDPALDLELIRECGLTVAEADCG